MSVVVSVHKSGYCSFILDDTLVETEDFVHSTFLFFYTNVTGEEHNHCRGLASVHTIIYRNKPTLSSPSWIDTSTNLRLYRSASHWLGVTCPKTSPPSPVTSKGSVSRLLVELFPHLARAPTCIEGDFIRTLSFVCQLLT